MTVSPDARAAARDHLAAALSQRPRFEGVVGGGPGPEPVEPALEALLAVGAISVDDAAGWRTRFARAEEAVPEPDPALRERALGHIEELGDHALPAVKAFEAVGAITRSDAGRWIGRYQLRRRPPAAAPDDDGEPPICFDDSVLRRSLLGPAARDAGVRVTVVELYAGGVVVHWHLADTGDDPRAAATRRRITEDPEGPHPLRYHEPKPLVVLADDVGTEYRVAGSAAAFAEEERYAYGYHDFGPAAPEHAARLEVAIRDAARVTVRLDQAS